MGQEIWRSWKRIGLFGGTFDPPHIGHLIAAEQAMIEAHLDGVLFMPANIPPHKKGRAQSALHRLAMVREAVKTNEHFVVSDWEIQQQQVSYSLYTIDALQAMAPSARIVYIMGEDSFLQLQTWFHWEELIQKVEIAVVRRPHTGEGFAAQWRALQKKGAKLIGVDRYALDISSTKLREDLAEGRKGNYLLPSAVQCYIHEQGLYRPDARTEDFLARCAHEDLSLLEEEPYVRWRKRLKSDLSAHRFEHVHGVVRAARVLAREHGVSIEKATQAALLHDCAKKKEKHYFDAFLERGWVEKEDWKPSPVFHAWLGARVAHFIYDVKDQEILRAIASHTTGREAMDDLEKIIYLADMMEPGRDFAGVQALRALYQDLNAALLFAMHSTLQKLEKEHRPVDPTTKKAYDYLLKQNRG